MEKIKVILFDIDGVMIRCPHYFGEELESKGYDNASSILAEFFIEKNKGCTEGSLDIKEEIFPYLKRMGWKKSAETFLNEQYAFESQFFDMSFKKIITDLQKLGIYCALATSQENTRANYMLQNLGFEELFDSHYISCNIGFRKDSPKYWNYILGELHKKIPSIQAVEVAFFDDQQKIIDEAKSHGIQAFLFTDMKQFGIDMKKLGFEI